ncbi:hypothetical protein GCM10011494_22820 [Novosphingobium endophyticum]|uniref:Uncharacterized protein n=1 Tax=Novosphingobium endophyticum TaxID=1955250 RepID=A0A916TT66_9SPHN|nr:hypothetical protein [Novosphingobium endophyticum]GGC03791.1 hypothetical protein GCM10011494_22820 [Novosphingobium endophyticum]
MSEYQYYEFQAVDHPLDETDRQALRAISTRARITATSFTNSYEWGDLKGDPADFMKRWFDLHLYLANWGTRRLMIRLPKKLVDQRFLKPLLLGIDWATLQAAGDTLILDIARDEVELDEDWDDGSGWLAALAPLRADLLAGDLRLFYLLWLGAIEAEGLGDDEIEPMAGIGPLTGALGAFAEFFDIDPDLVQAAADRPMDMMAMSPAAAGEVIAAMTDREKTDLLTRLFGGDPNIAVELRALVRKQLGEQHVGLPNGTRTAGELRSRARAIRLARDRAKAEKAAADRRRQLEEAEKARLVRIDALARRGEGAWQEVEAEIERRNAPGYDKAVALLVDLRAIAETQGAVAEFGRRLHGIRERHARKERFIERLTTMP